MTTRQTGAEFNQVIDANASDLIELQRYDKTITGYTTKNITVANLVDRGGTFYVTVTTTSQNMSVNTVYGINNEELVRITLPATSSAGDIVGIVGFSTGLWKLMQNSSQIINFGNNATSVGTAGSVSSTKAYDSITLRCVVANTTWVVTASNGGPFNIV